VTDEPTIGALASGTTRLPTEHSPVPERIRPRLRVAAIVWGLILAACGTGLAWFVLDPHRVTAFGVRVLSATPGDVAIGVVAVVLVIGVIIVVGSTLSVVHRGQDRARDRREKEAAIPAEPAAGQDETTGPAAQ